MSFERNPASFRDPSGYVFSWQGRIFRALDKQFSDSLRQLVDAGIWQALLEGNLLVPSFLLTEPALRDELASHNPGYAEFLEHEVIPTVVYPYEWSFSMLADAALLTLELQLCLAEAGYSLKDASAYNIQFVKGRPIFIDVASIERPLRADLWYALGQFSRMFLFPLLLCARKGWDIRSYFQSSLDGRTLQQVGRCFHWYERLLPGLLLDVTLPLLLEGKAVRQPNGSLKAAAPSGSSQSAAAQIFNLKRLRRKIERLARSYRPKSHWSDYTETCSYDSTAEVTKKRAVREWLEETRPRRVLDLGCNTGDYSFIAADCGATVVSADGDSDSIDLLYRRLREKPASITPMVVDIANPSPGIGYLNVERAPFLQRAKGDCVLALALMHHLLVSANLSLHAIRDLLHSLTIDTLLLEFVPPSDPMFRRLVQFRANLHSHLTLEDCLAVFGERFRLIRRIPMDNSDRVLLCLRRLAQAGAGES